MAPEFHPPNPDAHERRPSDAPEETPQWHNRGYLPHFDGSGITQSITFRLADSLPGEKLQEWNRTLRHLDEQKRKRKRRKRIERYLDSGHGNAWLKMEPIARSLEESLFYHDEQQYVLHAWVIMPNHVHVLVTLDSGISLSKIIKGWKRVTAKKANKLLDRSGSFWQRGYFDRYMRNEEHFWDTVRYIEYNPVKADLCEHPSDWRWGSARYREEREITVMDYDLS